MRIPITVQAKLFDIEEVQPKIDAARESFARYLAGVPRKTTRSKHGLMGPVGKILGEIKSGRRDPASLKGYAIRVHEATGYGPTWADLSALETGIDQLVGLLTEAPIPSHDRILDRLDHGLYYQLRKAALESKEARRQAWVALVRGRYGSESTLSGAWGEEVASIDELYLPRKAEGARGKKATAKQRDVADFWASQGATVAVFEEEDE